MLTKATGLIAFCQIMSIIAVLYTIVGLIRPRWAWLGDNPPNRIVISTIGLVLFMASFTGYSALALKQKEASAPVVEKPTAQQQETDALQKALQAAPTVPVPPAPAKTQAQDAPIPAAKP